MKAILISLCLLAFIACAKSSLPTYSVEVRGTSTSSIHLIDRQITGITLNTSERGYAVIEISTLDKIQIGNKVNEIPWTIKLRLQESNGFRIIK